MTERRGKSTRGRTPVSLSLNDDKVRVLGLNIRPEYCQIAVAGLSGTMQHTISFATPTDPDELVARFAKAVNRLEFDIDHHLHMGYKRVGIAVPGHVDLETGRILWTPTHPELAEFDIARSIAEKTGMDVMVDNDCNLGALSEMWLGGEASDELTEDFAFLNVSDYGAGAGMVIGGEPYRGHDTHFVAEFGHMIVEPDGPLCPCGRRGCWERFVCNTATWERYKPGEPYSMENFQRMLESAGHGDETAMAAIRETSRYLALGLSNMALVLNPATIVVAAADFKHVADHPGRREEGIRPG